MSQTPPVRRTDDGMIVPETAVPPNEQPAMRCPYCERPFTTTRDGQLHVGEAHAGHATEEEQAAYAAAKTAEADQLFIYHLKIVGALSVLYSMAVLGYMVVLGAG